MTEAERIESIAADWLARRDGERWSETEQRALDAWIAESIAHRVAWLRLASAWRRSERLGALHTPQAPVAARARERSWLPRFSVQRMAAGVLIAVAGAGWLAWNLAQEARGDGHYATAVGARQSVTLRDGSVLTLNTATQLRTAVNENGRKVWLDDGEAYFDIAHDKAHPFVVIAGHRRITVLGTRFLVRRQGDQVKLTVEEGRVQVASTLDEKGGEPTVLTHNQSAVASTSSVLVMSKSAKQVNDELSWRQGRLVFDQTTLGEAATQFNRYNTRKLVISDPAVQGIRIGGSFDVHNMEGFVSLLKQGFGLSAHDAGNETRVSGPS